MTAHIDCGPVCVAAHQRNITCCYCCFFFKPLPCGNNKVFSQPGGRSCAITDARWEGSKWIVSRIQVLPFKMSRTAFSLMPSAFDTSLDWSFAVFILDASCKSSILKIWMACSDVSSGLSLAVLNSRYQRRTIFAVMQKNFHILFSVIGSYYNCCKWQAWKWAIALLMLFWEHPATLSAPFGAPHFPTTHLKGAGFSSRRPGSRADFGRGQSPRPGAKRQIRQTHPNKVKKSSQRNSIQEKGKGVIPSQGEPLEAAKPGG